LQDERIPVDAMNRSSEVDTDLEVAVVTYRHLDRVVESGAAHRTTIACLSSTGAASATTLRT
jgi:citrate lyase synthetase